MLHPVTIAVLVAVTAALIALWLLVRSPPRCGPASPDGVRIGHLLMSGCDNPRKPTPEDAR